MLNKCQFQCLQGDINICIDKISYNSESISANCLFVCIKGAVYDGHDYAINAIDRGAAAIVCSDNIELPKGITVIKVADTRVALAIMSSNYFGNPAGKLITIGVTGTKGKTTTTYMIKEILKASGHKVGLIGTIVIDTGNNIIESSNTTPESYEVQKYMSEMVEADCGVVVIEVSSQALMLKRVYGIEFTYGIFTNLAEDHIGDGEHKSFDEYAYWKSQLFRQCKIGIVNKDDKYLGKVIKNHTCDIIYYGFCSKSDLYCRNFIPTNKNGKLGIAFQLNGVYNKELVVNIPGRFTAYNAMAAISVCKLLEVSDEVIENVLKNIKVPGRLDMIPTPIGGTIMIDYAHNGTALKCLLEAVREYKPEKITCVFGCGGQRDKRRRYTMGEIASRLADSCIITSDNPRNEEPLSIISDIIIGVKKGNGNYTIIPDRGEAIKYAVENCKSNCITIIAGKGHETYQIIGNVRRHFDDKEEVIRWIEKVRHEQDYDRRN